MSTIFWIGYCGLLGLVTGAFLTKIIYRLPLGESIIPSSHCAKCKHTLELFEKIPLISWLLLRRKCKSCKRPISIMYPLIELVTGINSIGLYFLYFKSKTSFSLDFKIGLVYYIISGIIFIPIEIKHYIIPDHITLSGIILGFLLSLIPGGLSFTDSALGILVGGGSLWLIAILGKVYFKREALGGGLIKLLAMCGALFGLKVALWSLIFFSFFLSFAWIIPLLYSKFSNKKADGLYEAGPYLYLGTIIAILRTEGILTESWLIESMYLWWLWFRGHF